MRNRNETGLIFETLETRTLMSVAINAIATEFIAGQRTFRGKAPAIINQLNLEAGQTPLLKTSLARTLSADKLLQSAFSSPKSAKSIDSLNAALGSSGFKVQYLSTDPDASGDLLRVTYDKTIQVNPGSAARAGGLSGWEYLDAAHAKFGTQLHGGGLVHISLVAGVTLVGTRPVYYLADSSQIQIQADLAGAVPMTFSKGVYKLVTASVDTQIHAVDTVNFHDAVSPGDGRILRTELRALGDIVVGRAAGSVVEKAQFGTKLDGRIPVTWSGSATISLGSGGGVSANLNADAAAIGRAVGDGFFQNTATIPWMSSWSRLLNYKVPIVGKTVGDLLNLQKQLSPIFLLAHPNLAGASLSEIQTRLHTFGVDLNVGNSALDQLMNGQAVDLVTYHTSGSVTPLSGGTSVHLFDWKFLGGLVSADLDATFGLGLKIGWDLGLGLSTVGFYVASTSKITIGGSAEAGIEGSLSVLKYKLAKAGGSLSLDLNADLSIADPNHDGRTYLSEVGGSYSRWIQADVGLDLNGHVSGKIRNPLPFGSDYFTVFKKDFALANLLKYHLGPAAPAIKPLIATAPIAAAALPSAVVSAPAEAAAVSAAPVKRSIKITQPLTVKDGLIYYNGQPERLISYGDLGALAEKSFNYNQFFATLKRNGINMTRVWLTYGWDDSGAPFAKKTVTQMVNGRKTHVTKYDLTTYDKSYFTRLTQLLKAAAANGVFVQLTLFNGSELLPGLAWNHSPYNPANNINQDLKISKDNFGSSSGAIWDKVHAPLIKKVVDTVASAPNCILEISNEPGSHFMGTVFNKKVARTVADDLGANRSNHLISANVDGSQMAWAATSPDVDLISFHITGDYDSVTSLITQYAGGSKPLLFSNDGDITQRNPSKNSANPNEDQSAVSGLGKRAALTRSLLDRVFATGISPGRTHFDFLDKGINGLSWGNGIKDPTGYDPRASNVDSSVLNSLKNYKLG